MKYKCLVLDHDDTVVNSTATINYPSWQRSLEVLRPHLSMTLEEFFLYNFQPGFSALCSDILHFTPEEDLFQFEQWQTAVRMYTPSAYSGIREVIQRFRREGGYVCVVSHSTRETILRDYRENDLPLPDEIFDWGDLPERRKPSPYPLLEIMRRLHLQPGDLVVVDDLKPGKDMADACGVDFIGAGWSHDIPQIVAYMQKECPLYCRTVAELEALLFS